RQGGNGAGHPEAAHQGTLRRPQRGGRRLMSRRTAELRDLVDEELENRLSEARHELFNLRFQHVTGQLDNYARLGQVRRDLARIETILREREIVAAESGGAAPAPVMPASAAGSGGRASAAGSGGRASGAGGGDRASEA